MRVQASYVARVCSEFRPIIHMKGDQTANGNRIGVWMTNDIKLGMRRDMYTLLDTRRVHLHRHFTSQSVGMRGVLCNQLRNYKIEVKPAKDAFSKPKLQFTGKSYNSSDDLCIVMQMLCFWPSTFFAHPNAVRVIDPL